MLECGPQRPTSVRLDSLDEKNILKMSKYVFIWTLPEHPHCHSTIFNTNIHVYGSFPNLHCFVKALAEGVEDGAALLQFEGGWIFTEVLGHSITQRVQLVERRFHVGHFGVGSLGIYNKSRCKKQKCIFFFFVTICS